MKISHLFFAICGCVVITVEGTGSWFPHVLISHVPHVSKQRVAFNAELSSTLSNVRQLQNIVYDNIITNCGNAYDKSDGKFTAPVDGIYFFSWTTMGRPNTNQHTELVLDGKHISHCYSGSSKDYNSASKTVILDLQAGNKVWIRTGNPCTNYLHGAGYNSFVGFSLS